MPDIYHYITNDLNASPQGDLLTVDALTLGQQRVLRRLLTNPGDYVWHKEYGAGLPALIGNPVSTQQVEGIIRQQLLLESAVAQDPRPVIKVRTDGTGAFYVNIQYADVDTGSLQTLSFDVKE